jgi:UDP-N-acetylglucosamine 2-epimerase (non-hydrolysing)
MRIVSIVSARPNFIKLAGFYHAFVELAPKHWRHLILHTGQHYDPLFSDVFFQELNLPNPVKNLGVKSGKTNEETVELTREACISVLEELKPDLVMVYGDVSGALGGAQAANDLHIPVAHIEAGLRSFDDDMPEERNRKAIDQLSQFLFVTEKSGMENLENEYITEGVHFVGNIMIDTLERMKDKINSINVGKAEPATCSYGVVTLHRPSNVDDEVHLRNILDFLVHISKQCRLIFPVHHRTTSAIQKFKLQSLLKNEKIECREPMGYIDFLRLMDAAKFVLTDSGGIQEEATYRGVRCFTLRKNTERPCTLEENCGTNVLIDSEEKKALVLDFASREINYMDRIHHALKHQPELWDGKAGERIMKIIREFL